MAAITWERLTRGIKLLRQHLFTPLSAAATALSAKIAQTQMKEGWGSFRINLNVPCLGGSLFNPTEDLHGLFMVPFALPPVQEFFSIEGQSSATTPLLVLDEITIGFDQRGEPAAIHDKTEATAGLLDYDNLEKVTFTVSLREQGQEVFGSAGSDIPNREIFSAELTDLLFTDRNYRANPFLLDGIEQALNPYRTYTLCIDAVGLAQAAAEGNHALVALQVSLRIRTPLIARDTGSGSNAQNIPTKHSGGKTGATVTIQTPVANSTILADGATGAQTNIEVVDRVLLSRLKGGYTEWSDVPPTEHLQHDACYDVIAVPLFGRGVTFSPANVASLPYIGAGPLYKSLACDRRIIPLKYPFTLHHVIAVANHVARPNAAPGAYTDPKTAGGANWITRIGVGLGVGFRSDEFNYQQLALLDCTGITFANYSIDSVEEDPASVMGDKIHLLNVPLVYPAGGTRGLSYPTTFGGVAGTNTGPPIYCGKSHLGTQARSNIANAPNGTSVSPVTGGQEQFIEVRWSFGDTVNGMGHAATYPAGTIFVGYGGHWVFLIGKKHLA